MNQPYPGGHVEYFFKMHVDHARSLSCNVSNARIKKIEINKISPDDPFDQKWRLVIIFNKVNSIQEVDNLGAEFKENVFTLLSFSLKEKIIDIRQTGHGLVPRDGEGAQCHLIMPSLTCSGEVISGGRNLIQTEINEIENNLFTEDYSEKLPLVNLFNYAMRASDQVVQFIYFI